MELLFFVINILLLFSVIYFGIFFSFYNIFSLSRLLKKTFNIDITLVLSLKYKLFIIYSYILTKSVYYTAKAEWAFEI